MIFHRDTYTELWIRILSDESLGLLDSNYIEDYFGQDGQLTLRNLNTNSVIAVPMLPLNTDTPNVNNDSFLGYLDLTTLPNGDYQLEGRVIDLVGNYTILSDFENPLGTETVIPYTFTILSGQGSVVDLGSVLMFGGYTFNLSIIDPSSRYSKVFEGNEETKVRVLSDIDSEVSTTYNLDNMLDTNFSEGKDIKTAVMKDITLETSQLHEINFITEFREI